VTAEEWRREADRTLLGLYAPTGVLVSHDMEILQFRGRTGRYLEPSPGEPTHNLLHMARAGLFPELRNAIDECQRRNAAVRRPGVRIRGEERILEIDLSVVPVKLPGVNESCFLIVFEEGETAADQVDSSWTTLRAAGRARLAPKTGWWRRWITRNASATRAAGGQGGPLDDQVAAELKQELAATRDYLQRVIEEKDATNEEMKSANEEIQSSNEELQSTNEELTTAKEELQSVNEELTTTNEQLQQRNHGLNRLNDAVAQPPQ
jgi:two-component system CheB/CheR fusion protein